MSTTPTQIRIDTNVKKKSTELFKSLGMDMSGAVNIFLNQCILHNGLPFKVEMPQYKQEVLSAMDEAKILAKDPNVESYATAEELHAAIGV